MKFTLSALFTLLALFLLTPNQADAQVAIVRVDIGGPTVRSFAYRPGLLTVRPTPDVVVVRKHAIDKGQVIVYKDRPDYIIRAHHTDFTSVGFTRVSTRKRGQTTTIVYKRGDERVKLIVKPNRNNWEARIVAI